MATVVVGCGRSGTNIVVEMLRGSPELQATKKVDNNYIFTNGQLYSSNYLTKCHTCYFNYEQLKDTMEKNVLMQLIFIIRDPRDIILSKLYRGQPFSKGGDCPTLADDATPEGALIDIFHMYQIFMKTFKNFKSRVVWVKMENILLDPVEASKALCKFLCILYNEEMQYFPKHMRNSFKVKRYGEKIDLSQIGLWKHWEDVYDGYFRTINYSVEDLFDKVTPLVEYFKY